MAERDIFLDALDLPDADRPAFVAARCGADADLRRRVESLLAAYVAAGRFLEQPPSAAAGTIVYTPPSDGPAAGPEQPGDVLAGRYTLLERIGEGGMGSVWMAEQTEPVKRKVAVKLIRSGLDSRAVLARFEAERQALAVMDHPNIAKVLDGGLAPGGRPYFVMEMVRGVPITQFCDHRKLTPRDRLALFVPVCEAIQHAHQKGIIHRDIKPSNVLVAEYDGRPVPKVIDFGVAKAAGQPLTDKTLTTGFGAVVGTPEYMSPEQASFNNLDVDTRSDVYSLGVLLYELLTGGTPVDQKGLKEGAVLEVLRIVREVDAPRPSARLSTLAALPSVAASRGLEPTKLTRLVRGELDWIALKALEKDRGRRYETAAAFGQDVARYLRNEPVAAGPPGVWYRARKFLARNRVPAAAAAVAAVALIGGTAGTALGLIEARRQRDTAVVAEQAETVARQKAEREHAEADVARAKAESEADGRRRVLEFFQFNILAAPRPTILGPHALGKDVTVREAVERAEPKIAAQFAGQPLLEAAVRFPIGNTYIFCREWAKAIAQHDRAYTLRRQELGDTHPDSLQSLNQLARAHRGAGNLDTAIALYRRGLDDPAGLPAIRDDKPGQFVQALEDLANTYYKAGRPGDGIPLLTRALAFRPAGDKRVPERLRIRSVQLLADCYAARGEPAGGAAALTALLPTTPPARPRTQFWRETALATAGLWLTAGHPDRAWPLAVALCRGPAADNSFDAHRLLVESGLGTGRAAEAEAAVRKWLAASADDSPERAGAVLLLGRLDAAAGRSAEAEATLREAVDRLAKRSPARGLHGEAMTRYGSLLLAAGRAEQAREYLTKGHTRARAVLADRPLDPDDRRRLADAIDARLAWADATGRRKLAADLRAEKATCREFAPPPRPTGRTDP